jgi:hypothetical protein
LGNFSASQGHGFQQLFEYIINYIETTNYTNAINFTAAENATFADYPELIQQISDFLHITITTAKQIYDAYLNGSLSLDYMLSYLRDLWLEVLSKYIPTGWFNPGIITLTNDGYVAIRNIEIVGDFSINNRSLNFLKFAQDDLTPGNKVKMELSLASLILAMANLAFDEIVGVTLSLLKEDPIGFLKNFTQVFHTFSLSFELNANVRLRAVAGFMPFSIDFHINLQSIVKKLEEKRNEMGLFK